MIKFSIVISDLRGGSISYVESFPSLKEAIAFGERRVAIALATPRIIVGEPIFLNVVEEDNLINPSFFMGRYGTSEDAPIVAPIVFA